MVFQQKWLTYSPWFLKYGRWLQPEKLRNVAPNLVIWGAGAGTIAALIIEPTPLFRGDVLQHIPLLGAYWKTKLDNSLKYNTFKPNKKAEEGTKQYQLKQYADATLGNGNLKSAIICPEGEDLNEWLAVNIVDFFNQINMLYGTITEFCTPQACPVMSAGPKYDYQWMDGVIYKKPIKVSAPEYVDFLMTWIQTQIDDEKIFPSKLGIPFQKNFQTVIKTIAKRLFRVYAHIYHSHFSRIVMLGEEAHLNTSFKHFVYFVGEFGLVEKKELGPMEELIKTLCD